MDPVVYDFRINEKGTHAELLHGDDAIMVGPYMELMIPRVLGESRATGQGIDGLRRVEFNRFAQMGSEEDRHRAFRGMTSSVFPPTHQRLTKNPSDWEARAGSS